MKIAFISSYDNFGGAAQSMYRLVNSLNTNVVEVSILVMGRPTKKQSISANPGMKYAVAKFREVLERLIFIRKESAKEVRFSFSLDYLGQDISRIYEVVSADIIHLHWIHKAFLSINSLKKIASLNKPIVWSLHDMWAFTGGCHYIKECKNYIETCGNCQYLKNSANLDLSYVSFKNKQSFYQNLDWTFIASSDWLKLHALRSGLLRNAKVLSIPTPIDTELFRPKKNNYLREKSKISNLTTTILFSAMNILDERKGFKYFQIALNKLSNKGLDIEVFLLGKLVNKDIDIPFKFHHLGILHSQKEIAEIYNGVDLYVMPSLEDNLPNTILESLSCGIPVVAFNCGGIPQMIDHLNNGYLAEYKSTKDLSVGIETLVKNKSFYDRCVINARKKIESEFSQSVVSSRYMKVYSSLIPQSPT